MRRHVWVPDTQVKPGVPIDHIAWVGAYIAEKKPEVIGVAGDWYDLASLNSHEEKGSAPLEGARYKDDIDSGRQAFEIFLKPIESERDRLRKNKQKRWEPETFVTLGNHEIRADRAALNDPKWLGHIGSENCWFSDFERVPFLKIKEVDGIQYTHFFKMQNSNNAIGGSTDNRLNKIGRSHTQGHQVGFLYGNRVFPDGSTRHSLTAGSCYLHFEDYRGPQCNAHFRGIIFKNEVKNGNYDIMPISLGYLCRKYEGMELQRYMKLKYPFSDWEHLA